MLTTISMFFVCSGIIIAVIIAYDLMRHEQSMKIMNAVWILTGLWASYLALWAYWKFGREDMPRGDAGSGMKMSNVSDSNMQKMPGMDMKMDMQMDMNMDMSMPMNMDMKRPHWQSVALSALHCGAGCTLADIIGEWFTYFFPLSIAGSLLAANWTLDFVLALILGVYFQFYAIRQMEKISVSAGLKRAFQADFFSLLAWQIGMYGWMALVHFVFFKGGMLDRDTWTFWFMMQIAMLTGFVCAYPVNALLIKYGVKKGM